MFILLGHILSCSEVILGTALKMTLGGFKEPYGIPRIEPIRTLCKLSVLPSCCTTTPNLKGFISMAPGITPEEQVAKISSYFEYHPWWYSGVAQRPKLKPKDKMRTEALVGVAASRRQRWAWLLGCLGLRCCLGPVPPNGWLGIWAPCSISGSGR